MSKPMRTVVTITVGIAAAAALILGAYQLVSAQGESNGAQKTEMVEQTKVYVPDEMHFTNIKGYLVDGENINLTVTSQVWDGDPSASSSKRVGTARTHVASTTQAAAFYRDLLGAQNNPFEAMLKGHKSQGDVPSDLDIPTNLKQL